MFYFHVFWACHVLLKTPIPLSKNTKFRSILRLKTDTSVKCKLLLISSEPEFTFLVSYRYTK